MASVEVPLKESDKSEIKLKIKEKTQNSQTNNVPIYEQKAIIPNTLVQNQTQPKINNMISGNVVNNQNSIAVLNLPTVGMNIGPEHGFVPIINPKEFGSKPISTYCPSCRAPITTVSSKKCNCCSCIFCWCCFEFWIFIQCCRKKEITFCDYEHKCPKCGFIVGNYDAW